MLEWQRDWANKGNLRCGNGHREEPLRSLRDRRRVRVHDGARCAGYELSRVRGFPRWLQPTSKNPKGGVSSALLNPFQNPNGDCCVY